MLSVAGPTAELMDGAGEIGELIHLPTLPIALRRAGRRSNAIDLRALVAASVHGEEHILGTWARCHNADRLFRKGQLDRPAATGRHPPELVNAGNIGKKSEMSACKAEGRSSRGANVEKPPDVVTTGYFPGAPKYALCYQWRS